MTAAETGSERDTLTGLASRQGIEDFLRARSSQADQKLQVASVELAYFGDLNNAMGSDLANKVMQTTSRRLKKIFPDADLIGRTHGDHFCLVFSGDRDWSDILERLLDFTQRPIALQGQVIVLSVRVGFADSDGVENTDLLLNAAEAALHKAKREKRFSVRYQDSMTSEAQKAYRLENDLRLSLVTHSVELHRALNNDEFQVFYQPIVDPHDGSVQTFEALLRWNHPERGMVSPGEFIPLAERIQVIELLSDWVIRVAMKDAMEFPENGHGKRPAISINISPVQFANPAILLKSIQQGIAESGIDPARVKLEITESAAFGALMVDTLGELKALGVRIVLDDFGTGYSSLVQLSRLPIDTLKIDRSFILGFDGDDSAGRERTEKLYRAILSVADAFAMETIAEGIETAEQLEKVTALGVGAIQGFLYSRPVPLDQAREFRLATQER